MLKSKKIAELREIAESFGVNLDGITKKADILAALQEEGVTDSVPQQFDGSEVVDETPSAPEPKVASGPEVLVKMEKANPTYELRGYRFTSAHPYVAMNESDAQEIFDLEPRGFRIATPAEVREYYS